MVVVTLPLSALWSAAAVDGRGSTPTQESGARRKLWHVLSSTSNSTSNTNSIPVQFERTRRAGSVPESDDIELLNRNLDLEKGKGIQVKKEFILN